jgi:protein gp37
MENSKIGWTDHTLNPWRGCTKVSAGCQNCYAEEQQARYNGAKWGDDQPRIIAAESSWKNPIKWNKDAAAAGIRARVFCASLADVFEDRPELVAPRERLFHLIEATPHLDWLLLSKRPENMQRLTPPTWAAGWPENAWAMCTVEDQVQAKKRIPHLMQVPAKVRGVSVEPMLGPVNLANHAVDNAYDMVLQYNEDGTPSLYEEMNSSHIGLDWVICGGESGDKHRPFDLAWARDLEHQCMAERVAFFMKQLGGFPDKKDQLEDLPADLQKRQWPGGHP